MKTKKLLATALALSLALGSVALPAAESGVKFNLGITASAEDEITSGDFKYTLLSDGTAEITGYTGQDSNLTIPDTIDGIVVTKIGSWSFQDSADFLISITIPDTVTWIGQLVFYGCTNLRSINLSQNIQHIGDTTFYGCSSLESIVLPNGLTSIEKQMFSGCKSLKNIEIPNSVTSIGEYAFYGCSSLKSINLPDNVTTIGTAIFEDCINLTSIAIPENVTNISDLAFCGCNNLKEIELPNKSINFGDLTFFMTNINDIYYSGSKEEWQEIINYNDGKLTNSTKIHYNAITKINNDYKYEILSDNTIKITKYLGDESYVKIPRTINGYEVSKIGSDSFSGDWNEETQQYESKIQEVIIPNGVTDIESSAFFICSNLKKITIPSSVVTIGSCAFYGCRELNNVIIPNGVQTIGNFAFDSCSNLSDITISSTVSNIGVYAFGYKNGFNYYFSNGNVDLKKIDEFCMLCLPTTFAETYATNYGLAYLNTYGETVYMKVGEQKNIIFSSKTLTEFDPFNINLHVNDNSVISASTSSILLTQDLCKYTISVNSFNSGSTNLFICDKNGVLQAAYIIYVEDNYLANTVINNSCTSDGWIEYNSTNSEESYCEKKPAFGHNYSDEWIIDIPETCTTSGLKSHHCLNCDEKIDVTNIPATGHNFSDEWTIDTPATCTTTGSKSHHCANCDEKADVIEIPATGHSFGIWTAIKEPNCTESGIEERICSACEEKETREIDATGHKFSDKWTIDTPATCTTTGSKSHHCANCDEKADVTEIPATGHTVVIDKAVPAGCTTDGKTEGSHCSVCGKVIKAQETVKATGHKYGEWTITKKATCTTAGVKTRICSVCGNKETVSIPATGHKYKTTVVAPTYASKGYTLHKCSCGASYKDKYTAKKTVPTVKAKTTYTCTSNAVRINWNKVSGATGYKIYRYNSKTKKWDAIKTITGGTTTSYKNSSLKSGTVYKYKVKAFVKQSGKYYYGNSSSTITTATKPATAKITKTSKSTTSVSLYWKKVTCSGYKIQKYNPSTKKWTTVKTVSSGTTNYKISGLKSNTSYKFRVCAYKSDGKNTLLGDWSTVTVKTAAKKSVSTGGTKTGTTSPTQNGNGTSSGEVRTYVLNTSTMKFHLPTCRTLKRMNGANKQDYKGTRNNIIAQGYSPCGVCNPL